jgi:hypothetical protein
VQQVVVLVIHLQPLQHKAPMVLVAHKYLVPMLLVDKVEALEAVSTVLQIVLLELLLHTQVVAEVVAKELVAVLVAQVAVVQEQHQALDLHQLSVLQTLALVVVVVLELLDLATAVLVVLVLLLLVTLLQEQTFQVLEQA